MRSVTLDDVAAIEQAIVESNAKLVIIDPLQSCLPADVDSHKANQTRAKLDPLVGVAERSGAAILIVAHMAKASGARAIHSMLGSIDIAAAMRSILLVGTPPDNPEDRAVLLVKHSVGPMADGLSFRIVKTEGKGSATKIEWRGIATLRFSDLRAPETARRTPTQKERACEWLTVHPTLKVRELTFLDRTRSDVILLDRNNKTVIVECKQGQPSVAAINQLRRYLAHLKKEKGIVARGILVHGGSKKLHDDVVSAANTNPKIEIVQHRLAVDFARCN